MRDIDWREVPKRFGSTIRFCVYIVSVVIGICIIYTWSEEFLENYKSFGQEHKYYPRIFMRSPSGVIEQISYEKIKEKREAGYLFFFEYRARKKIELDNLEQARLAIGSSGINPLIPLDFNNPNTRLLAISRAKQEQKMIELDDLISKVEREEFLLKQEKEFDDLPISVLDKEGEFVNFSNSIFSETYNDWMLASLQDYESYKKRYSDKIFNKCLKYALYIVLGFLVPFIVYVLEKLLFNYLVWLFPKKQYEEVMIEVIAE